MICYRDRTYCQTPSCGDPDCPRILSPEEAARAQRVGLPISYAVPCLRPQKEQPE